MSLYKQYKTDSEKEANGVKIVFDDVENANGTNPFFILARSGGSNKAYAKALEAKTKQYRRGGQIENVKNEILEKIFMEVFIETILKGWGNQFDENDIEIYFSKLQAEKLLTDLPDVYERLQTESKQAANYRLQGLEKEAGN
jgi:hypothetical protein